MKLLLAKVKKQFAASSINEKKEIVLSDEKKIYTYSDMS